MTIHQSIRQPFSSRWLAGALAVTLVAALSAAAVTQNISGTVTYEGTAIEGIHVDFLDAANAEALGSATTDSTGAYDSGLVPAGDYRVRFSDPLSVANPGSFASQFFGAGGADSFCAATVVTLASGGSTIVDDGMGLAHSDGILINPAHVGVSGVVRSAATGAPLPGIEVRIFSATNAVPISVVATNPDGVYAYRIDGFFMDEARVRFFDPAGRYFPQFFAAGVAGSDDFCAGGLLDLNHNPVADVSLRPIPPAQLTENLGSTIETLGLPSSVESMLRTPLTQAVALLSDANPNNDTGVCAQLRSFISRVEVQERRGQLSPADAAALRESTAAILASLGCQ
jgi:hypothetical protein